MKRCDRCGKMKKKLETIIDGYHDDRQKLCRDCILGAL